MINRRLAEEKFKEPGPTGTFGNLTFSHELLHRIGGDHDTNRNTTQRILLLLESSDVGAGSLAWSRVTRALIQRYVEDDRGYHASSDWRIRVPRFLLNDVVRYWRTMAVDFAAKRRERGGKGWAIRNFKLRCSRKLLFTAGLAMCLRCELFPTAELTEAASAAHTDGGDTFYAAMADFLTQMVARTPLDLIADFCNENGADSACRQMLTAYDRFLAILDNEGQRTELETMDLESAMTSTLFRETKDIGNEFQDGLTTLFFGTNDALTKATQRYGVF